MQLNKHGLVTGFIFGVTAFGFSSLLVVTQMGRPEKRNERGTETSLAINDIEEYVINNINAENIRDFLREITQQTHLGGTEKEKELAEWVAENWRAQGLDQVHLVPYEVLLSYPDAIKPNQVQLKDADGNIVWKSPAKQKPLYTPEESLPEVPFTFNGYAAPGTVTGDVVYANYGREEDFDLLAENGIDISGKIILARYGKIFRANIAEMAESRGALGVILYSDPANYAPQGSGFVYPNSYYLPPSAAPFGTVKLVDGDPLTPYYPATDAAFHIPEEEAPIPKIPVHPIGYEDAWQIISRIGGSAVPSDWQGNLNVTYHFGPGLSLPQWNLTLSVHNSNTPTTTYNVIGIIRGKEEPDRYVMLGNHIDAWIFGALDPSSGTAAMLELSRVFKQYSNETGWQPRRSIIFCAWGAEEYGLVGSMEWTEEFGKQLADRTVAYLNVDMAIEGNYTLRTKSAPILHTVIYESAKKIQNPDPEEVAEGRLTLYDTWALRRPDPDSPEKPLMQFIGSGSDYKGFQHNLGIPCMDTRYTHDNATLGEPMYHTLYETFAAVDEIYDEGFHFHKAVTALWGDLAIVLSESKILPFSLDVYADFMWNAHENIVSNYGDLIASQNISLEYFSDAIEVFNTSVHIFADALDNLTLSDPLAIRHRNDQLMMVERAFIDPRGLPGRPEYNHVVMAPSKKNAYDGTAFSGLTDTLLAITDAPQEDQKELWRTFKHHLAAVTHFVRTAGKVLTDELW